MAILAFQKPDKVLMLEVMVLPLAMPYAVFSCLHWKGLLLRLSKSME